MTGDFEIKNERAWWRWLLIWTLGGIGFVLAVLLLGMILTVHSVKAAPVATAGDEQVVITLTDEACTLTAVTNLKLRATWAEKGVTHEGCYAVGHGLVLTYWADKTVAAIPAGAFARVTAL